MLNASSNKRMDPAKVPEPLRHLIPTVQKWGAVTSDSERYEMEDLADGDDRLMAELEVFAKSWSPAMMSSYEVWSEKTDLSESFEFSKFYFMWMMLDALEIRFPKSGPKLDPVKTEIEALQKVEGIAAVSSRAWAARNLGGMGAGATEAIPALIIATNDPVDSVRIWAHAALALIAGDIERHRAAINVIGRSPKASTSVSLDAKSALAEIDKPAEARIVDRLCSAAIMNDVATIEKLSALVNVNRPNHNQSTAIQLAVGNGHAEALRALFEAGADPNQRDRHEDDTVLHDAAKRRRGSVLISLLLDKGADPHLKNKKGQTALDVAHEYGRKKNIPLLQEVTKKKRRWFFWF